MAATRPEAAIPGAGSLSEAPALAPELVAHIRRLEIRARHLATARMAGSYRSIFRGSGIEFAEAREYVPGDDIRLIDWNVTARLGEPWVKEFVEERELHLVCAVDLSASQLVARAPGGRLEAAAAICALLTLTAAHNHDRAGLLTFSDQVERFVPPAHGTKHAMRIVREVLHHQPAHRGTSIGHACEYLSRVLRRRGAVFIMSDFFDQEYEQPLRTLARRHEVIAVTLVDLLDLELPDVGIIELQDAEGGERLLLDSSSEEVRRRYAEAARARTERRRHILATAGVDEIEIRLDADPVDPIVAFFHRRASA